MNKKHHELTGPLVGQTKESELGGIVEVIAQHGDWVWISHTVKNHCFSMTADAWLRWPTKPEKI